MKTTNVTWIFCAGMLLAACGKKDEPAPTSKASEQAPANIAKKSDDPKPAAGEVPGLAGSCDYRGKESWCGEYATAVLDKDGVDGELQKSMCEASKGKWSTAKCPTDKKLGACTDDEGYVRVYYASGGKPFDAASAKSECAGGKWEVTK